MQLYTNEKSVILQVDQDEARIIVEAFQERKNQVWSRVKASDRSIPPDLVKLEQMNKDLSDALAKM